MVEESMRIKSNTDWVVFIDGTFRVSMHCCENYAVGEIF